MDNTTPTADITALVLRFLDSATSDVDLWLALIHEDCVIEFPYGESAGLPQRVTGKEAIKNSTEHFLKTVPGIRFNNPVVFPSLDPHMAFAKYDVSVSVPATGKIYRQSYITIFKEADMKIISMVEYYDPVKFNTAFN